MCFVSLFYLLPLFYFTSPRVSLSSPLSSLSSRSSLPWDRVSAVFNTAKIITRPATALVSSLVNHPRRAGGEAIGAGVSDEDVHSLFIHHIFREINLHRISVTVPRQQQRYERGGKQLLRERQRRMVDSFRYNLINVTHLGVLLLFHHPQVTWILCPPLEITIR